MANTPTELSGEIVITHPNCYADFQFAHYLETENVNIFRCVKCGLCLRVDAFRIDQEPPATETATPEELKEGEIAEQHAIESLQTVAHDADLVPKESSD